MLRVFDSLDVFCGVIFAEHIRTIPGISHQIEEAVWVDGRRAIRVASFTEVKYGAWAGGVECVQVLLLIYHNP